MPAPTAELITVMHQGQPRELTIQPTIFSRRSMEALAPLYRKMTREYLMQDLVAINEMAMSDEEKAMAKQEVMGQLKKIPGLMDAAEVIQTPQGMIIALQYNAGLTREDATSIVNEQHSLLDIYKTIMRAGTNDVDSAKNSSGLAPTNSEA